MAVEMDEAPNGMADMDELRAYNEAMEMNRQLKAMLQQQQQAEDQQQQRHQQSHQQQLVPRRTRGGRGVAAGARKKANLTFTEQELTSMGRENQVLLDRMQRIALSSGTGMSSRPDASRYRKRVGNHGVNRQRMEKRVQNENHAFLRRLQSVKPTISRTKMKADARKSKKLARQMQTVKRRPTFTQREEWQS